MESEAVIVLRDVYVESVTSPSAEMYDVTMLNRPDPSWLYVDGAGHEHFWADGRGKRITEYSPRVSHTLPTLKQVYDDGLPASDPCYGGDDDDDYEPDFRPWHYECVLCGEHIQPRGMADTSTQFIPGPLSNPGAVVGHLFASERVMATAHRLLGPVVVFDVPAANVFLKVLMKRITAREGRLDFVGDVLDIHAIAGQETLEAYAAGSL